MLVVMVTLMVMVINYFDEHCTPVVRIKRPESIFAELLSIAAWEYLEWRSEF